MSAAGLEPADGVAWGEKATETGPGIYVVSLASDPAGAGPLLKKAPIDPAAIELLLETRPELTLDGERPAPRELADRLSAFWLPDEVILYLGLAGTSVANRVGQYYSTKLGARSPHAGGWFLKTLSVLPELSVHFAPCDAPDESERLMLEAFAGAVSKRSRDTLHDSERVMPFTNLEFPKGVHKVHGIKGAKAPKRKKGAEAGSSDAVGSLIDEPPRPAAKPRAGGLVTQRVTGPDLAAGRIRIPRASKEAFPGSPTTIAIELKSHSLTCRWDPRLGPPERSGF